MAIVADVPSDGARFGRSGDSYFWNSNVISNMLRNYNSYNYIITLGILSKQEYNNPNLYRSKGFDKILLRSGGGKLDKRIRTFAEGDRHAEYFIEDLEIDSVVAPNQNTGLTVASNISFKVIEPYSMGKFLEALIVGAAELKHPNHTQAPLGLQIEFVGWDTPGESETPGNESPIYVKRPVFIPIIISKMEFDVSEKGSTYTIEATAYSDSMMSNNRDSLKTDISASGTTVAEVLQTTYYGLAQTVNRRYETLEDDGIILGYDRYLILFPEKLSDILEVVAGGRIVPAALSDEVLGYGPGQVDVGIAERIIQNANEDIYNKLLTWSQTNINDIGKSVITESLRDGGNRRTVDAEEALDAEGLASPTVNPYERSYQFQTNESIAAIIQEVILASRIASENAAISDADGFRTWFRIKPMVFMESTSSEVERQLGRSRLTYVYAVYKFKTHESRHLPASQNPRGILSLRRSVRKIYNYIYTGKNEDVLNFDIKFNHSYFLPLVLDASNADGSRPGQLGDPGTTPWVQAASVRDGRSTGADRIEGGAVTQEETEASISGGGTGIISANSAKQRIAQLFHHRLLNSPVDLATGEIDIWGDPYFLPTDIGNYAAGEIDTLMTEDETMPHSERDVHIVVNFKTPIDYNDGLDGLMSFPDEEVMTFSGLYQVWAVTNIFSEGQFKQNLKLIRIINQNIDDPTDNTAYVEPRAGRLGF